MYDRLTIFEDHLVRDMNAGRYANVTVVMVTHGLALRIFLMRWLHWSVDEFERVYNPPNSQPIVLERRPFAELQLEGWHLGKVHTKEVYQITEMSRFLIPGCTEAMASTSRISCQVSDNAGAIVAEAEDCPIMGADSWEPTGVGASDSESDAEGGPDTDRRAASADAADVSKL